MTVALVKMSPLSYALKVCKFNLCSHSLTHNNSLAEVVENAGAEISLSAGICDKTSFVHSKLGVAHTAVHT